MEVGSKEKSLSQEQAEKKAPAEEDAQKDKGESKGKNEEEVASNNQGAEVKPLGQEKQKDAPEQ